METKEYRSCRNCDQPIYRSKDSTIWFHASYNQIACWADTRAEPKEPVQIVVDHHVAKMLFDHLEDAIRLIDYDQTTTIEDIPEKYLDREWIVACEMAIRIAMGVKS